MIKKAKKSREEKIVERRNELAKKRKSCSHLDKSVQQRPVQ